MLTLRFLVTSYLLLVVNACPAGWLETGETCYYLSEVAGSWAEAASYCRQFNAMLAEPMDDTKMSFLSEAIKSHQTSHGESYLGGNDIFVENQWVWSSSMTQIQASNWSPGEPNDQAHDEDCLALTNGGTLNDVPCQTKLTFICESENENSGNFIG